VAGNVTVTMTCLVGAVVRPTANPPTIPASNSGTTHQARRDGAAGARRSDTVMSCRGSAPPHCDSERKRELTTFYRSRQVPDGRGMPCLRWWHGR
jgi:hypothetical protein